MSNTRYKVYTEGKCVAESNTIEDARKWAKVSRDAGNDTTIYDSWKLRGKGVVPGKGLAVEFLRA